MGKISPVSAKYIVQASIIIDGIVDKPDVIGAIFGQTEGLLGVDLELRELQRSGRIGRIEVNVDTKAGKSGGQIIIPSSLDKAETAIVAAALEIIQRIGPCNAKIKVEKIEDVRVSKRTFVVERAKELLRLLMDSSIPDSQELADEVAYSVRVMEITSFGPDNLPAGPGVADSDEIIIVEGRADVVNLLKHGFKNAIAINGTSVPKSVMDLAREKTVTVFVDGDRGGDLIIKELINADIDFITKAPDGKEVEELTKKEIHQCIRSRMSAEQARMEVAKGNEGGGFKTPLSQRPMMARPQESSEDSQRQQAQSLQLNRGKDMRPIERMDRRQQGFQQRPMERMDRRQQPFQARKLPSKLSDEEKTKFSKMLEDLIGTRGAYVLDNKLNILGKVPFSELVATIKSLSSGIYAVVFDGTVDELLLQTTEKIGVKYLITMDGKMKGNGKVTILTAEDL
ncbi:DNA primase [Candidatus Woesearchaeota archaeon]|nr:DNA primase [Candidatus Woesearchaeota archaeon]